MDAKEIGFVFFFIEDDESGQPKPFTVIEFLGREWVVLTMLSDRETQALIPELIMPKGVMEYGSYGPESYQLGGILPANLFAYPPEPSVLAQYKVQNYFAAYQNADNQVSSRSH